MAKELAIPVAYGSYEELCKDETIDIIYIPPTSKGRYSAAKLALSQGKPVLLEKPFTLNAAGEELFAIAQEQGFQWSSEVCLFQLPKVKATIQEGDWERFYGFSQLPIPMWIIFPGFTREKRVVERFMAQEVIHYNTQYVLGKEIQVITEPQRISKGDG